MGKAVGKMEAEALLERSGIVTKASKVQRLFVLVFSIMTNTLALSVSTPDLASSETDNSAQNANSSLAGAGSDDLPAIIVTANKREQSLNDVGMTVAVLGADELAEHKIETLADLAAALPGLTYSSSEQNTPVFTLRGVGFNEASLNAYPTVSVYLDEAPLAFPALTSQGAFDLQRIEVLKGPQGTLFGQNSTGGAINYIAAKPTQEFAAGGDVSYGRFSTIELNGFISGPISDTIRGRIATHIVQGDDWQYSFTRNDYLGKTEVDDLRAILDWTPLDRLRFELTLSGWQDKSDPQAGQLIGIYPQLPAYESPALANSRFAPMNDRAANWSYGEAIGPTGGVLDPTPSANRLFGQAILRATADLSEKMSLTSLTSYVSFTQQQSLDYDAVPLDDDDLPRVDGVIHSVSQELRLANTNPANVRWVVGSNYQWSRITENDAITVQGSTEDSPPDGFLFENGFRSDSEREDYAFFGNVEYDIVPEVTLTAGARYTDNLTKQNYCDYDLGDGRIDATIENVLTALTGSAPVLHPLTSCVSIKPNLTAGTPFIGRLDQDNTSWKGGIDYKPTRDVLFYANVSRGFKAGSFPTLSASAEAQLQSVTQEEVTAYETGFKTQFDRLLTLNGAAFYYDYRNKQIRGKELDPVFGVLNELINVPKSRIYGLEIEPILRPTRELTISAMGTYLDSRVQDYTGTTVLGLQQNLAGSRIPYTPTWQGQLDAEYRWTGRRFNPFIGTTLNARSWSTAYIGGESLAIPESPVNRTAPGVDLPFEIDAYTTLDLRAGVEWGDGRWRVMLYGKNVLDRYYWNTVISAFDTVYRLAGRPATFGITIAAKL